MRKIIGVMGPGKAKPNEIKLAYKIGELVAKHNAVLLTGGMGGVMEAASKGAHERGGLVMAICPTYEKNDLNAYVDIPVITGMRGARNYMNIATSDLVIAIGSASAGTLSEISFAIQMEKPIIIINSSAIMRAYLAEFKCNSLHFVKNHNEIDTLLSDKKFKY